MNKIVLIDINIQLTLDTNKTTYLIPHLLTFQLVYWFQLHPGAASYYRVDLARVVNVIIDIVVIKSCNIYESLL